MSVKLGINGFGRIGRLVLRAVVENNKPVYYLKDQTRFRYLLLMIHL